MGDRDTNIPALLDELQRGGRRFASYENKFLAGEKVVERRLRELEELAEELWPGKDEESSHERNWHVWSQFDLEVPWDTVEFLEPDNEVFPTGVEAVEELCTNHLCPSLGPEAHGFGDYLRIELRRQGRRFEDLFLAQPPPEKIPWQNWMPAKFQKRRRSS